MWILKPRGSFGTPRGLPLRGPRAPKVWKLSGIHIISLPTACRPNFSLLALKIQILWSRGDFADAWDPSRTLGAPPGLFRAYILVGGCSFILTHMFPTRINHKTFCCNLFEVPPALYRTKSKWKQRPYFWWKEKKLRPTHTNKMTKDSALHLMNTLQW